jgi:PINIT domain
MACSPTHPATVEFPPNAEIRVNGHTLQATLRGPKKHPGRVTPPDLGTRIVIKAGYKNTIDFSYSGALKEFVCAVSYVEKVEIGTLVKKLDEKVWAKADVVKSREQQSSSETARSSC